MLDAFVQALPQLGIGGLFLLIFFVLVYRGPLYLERRNERQRDRAAIEGGQYERMDARLQRLEVREEECQRRLTEALHRIGELEGYMAGSGKANQEAAGIVAIERISEAIRKRKADE